jgi:hypothetical protein
MNTSIPIILYYTIYKNDTMSSYLTSLLDGEGPKLRPGLHNLAAQHMGHVRKGRNWGWNRRSSGTL